MQLLSKTQSSSRLLNFVLVSSGILVTYLLVSFFLVHNSKSLPAYSSSKEAEAFYAPTTLEHIVFGIAANAKSWQERKEYVRLWWKPDHMRGCAFLDRMPPANTNSTKDNDTSLPPICVSEDTSRFRYTYRRGPRSAIRVARVVLETVALNHSDVRWLVFGHDDTVFFPENLVKTLGKYDHRHWYYIGANSELYEENKFFGFGTAFGGAGFAISSPLAKVLAKFFDSCMERYPHLYGSDSRVSSCLAELGVGLTHEPGFHQFDVRGNPFGLLAVHPLSPLVSMHHIDYIEPIFPNMSRNKALDHLFEAARVDSERILQQTVCYDRWFSWTISISWGYLVQVFDYHVLLPDILPVQETYEQWKKGQDPPGSYNFDTKPPHQDPCRGPTVFFLDSVDSGKDGTKTIYSKSYVNCTFDMGSPKKLEEIRVLTQKLKLNSKQIWAPRRQCCDVLDSSAGKVMEIALRDCREDEIIYIHQ